VSSEEFSLATPDLIRNCRRCSRELLPGALECDYCHALVHSRRLDETANEAKVLEESGDRSRARQLWLSALPLLPPRSKQALWIQDHARSLETLIPNEKQNATFPTLSAVARDNPQRGTLRLGALLSFLAFIAIYSAESGARFGIGFATLILIHEMGHYIDIRRRHLPADMPIFLPGLGAYVRWRDLGVSLETRAAISLAGPFAGLLAAAACAALWWQTHNSFWLSLTRVGAALNLLNLIPVWILDGGHASLALSKGNRIAVLATAAVLLLALRENILLLVAFGAIYRSFFAKDLPPNPSRFITIYFIAVLTGLALILWLLPGHGFGIR